MACQAAVKLNVIGVTLSCLLPCSTFGRHALPHMQQTSDSGAE